MKLKINARAYVWRLCAHPAAAPSSPRPNSRMGSRARIVIGNHRVRPPYRILILNARERVVSLG